MEAHWQVYVLQCADATLYTGITRDLRKRLMQHNGEHPGGPKYTRGRRPVQVLWVDTVADRATALRREAAIKKLRRSAKLALVAGAAMRPETV